ncbi:patatin-like phospholipase domain-containing protein 2 [Xenopus laevis]|uniref:triacylglycerol lipase n=2 Tax=Xenopus laevis TaxID=8355 RepID=A0A974D853_XENLA|nr:patatin-like phospholipase domain-containing protein 2 [Xenopus laevis]OCT86061.1 hypothetical protein XELAEV_18019755mg [Xenopus laevis]
MFSLERGWNLSFAGCGFLGVYHIGVSSCLQERAPQILTGANKIYGASAGALNAAASVCDCSLAQCCAAVLQVAKEARKTNLGPLHPSFNPVKILKKGLYRNLPENAHKLATGKLCISLTRVSDCENVLVSEFNSKEELVQALICSSFVPIYCGIIPPSFRGVRYVDGGISNNLPEYDLKNTITVSPFSGESDICPRDTNTTNFHEVRLTNTSIRFSLGNLYRLTRALFPPEPTVLGEMCQQGYNDALRFLKDNNLLSLPSPATDLPLAFPKSEPLSHHLTCGCCVKSKREEEDLKRKVLEGKMPWPLDKRIVERLPPTLCYVLQEACREKDGLYHQICSFLPMRVASYMVMPYTLPVESVLSVALRLVDWFPDMPEDMRWMQEQVRSVAGAVYSQAKKRLFPSLRSRGHGTLRKCLSLPPQFHHASSYLSPNNYFSCMDLDGWVCDISSPSHLRDSSDFPTELDSDAQSKCTFSFEDSGVDVNFSTDSASEL